MSLAASGIRFNDYFFSEPVPLAAWAPPKSPGLYIVLVNDPNWAPKAYQPLCFGEFGNNAPSSSLLQDCRRMMPAANGKTLFVAVLSMPFSTSHQRLALRNELISAYNPLCQTEKPAAPPPEIEAFPRRRIGFVT